MPEEPSSLQNGCSLRYGVNGSASGHEPCARQVRGSLRTLALRFGVSAYGRHWLRTSPCGMEHEDRAALSSPEQPEQDRVGETMDGAFADDRIRLRP
jgi:hypothetical protein